MTATVLVADDYAMTEGISAGIERLIDAGCLSGTGAIVTSAHWPRHAPRLAARRGQAALGLHLNLTLGAPLTDVRLAPDGRLPDAATIVKAALAGRLDGARIEREIAAQLEAFAVHSGADADFVDGHQHVHALPIVREALIAALSKRYRPERPRPLVRDPGGAAATILQRGRAAAKAATVAWLARGFKAAVKAAGFPVNDTFAGFSAFEPGGVVADFASFARWAGRLHLVMCHPGIVDEELKRIDPVTVRRQAELDHLLTKPFPIWRPERAGEGGAIDWAAIGSEARG